MKALDTSDYRGQGRYGWPEANEEEDGYPLYVGFSECLNFSLTACHPIALS